MKVYHDLHLRFDTLLLADVFEKFRNNILKNYGLCTSHYLSAPGLSWNVMHKMQKLELELIPYPDMCIFFEKDKRGETSYISNGYSNANDKCLKSSDPKQEPKHIIYLDTKYLYAYAMSKFLATSRFKWTDPKQSGLNKYTRTSSKG